MVSENITLNDYDLKEIEETGYVQSGRFIVMENKRFKKWLGMKVKIDKSLKDNEIELRDEGL